MSKIRPRVLWLAAPLALALAGCVLPDRVARVEKDMADVRENLRQVRAEQERTRGQLGELQTRVASLDAGVSEADLAEIGVRLDQLGTAVAATEQRLDDLDQRVERAVAAPRSGGRASAPSVAPPAGEPLEPSGELEAAPGGAMPDAESLYNTAYADFSKGNYALAVSGFEEYVEKFPDSPLADNAMYWVGECHFSQGDFGAAVAAFDRLLETHPRSDKAAAANLKKGLAYLEQNDVRRAIVQLRFVVSEYPQSDESRVARDKLTSLGAS